MTNGKVQFEIDGIKRSLHFGMIAARIFTEKAVDLANKRDDELNKLISDLGNEEGTKKHNELNEERKEYDDIKSTAYIVYGGLCNQSHINDTSFPTFDEAYSLTERILQYPDILTKITDVWRNSEPMKSMLDKLPKPEEERSKKKVSQKPKVGTK